MSESDLIKVDFTNFDLQRFSGLPLKVLEEATFRALQRATIDIHRKAITNKRGQKRTWLTPSQKKGSKPRGYTSRDGYVPVDTGRLRGSIEWSFDKGLSIDDYEGMVFSDVIYAGTQENNRGFFKRAYDATQKDMADIIKTASLRAIMRHSLG